MKPSETARYRPQHVMLFGDPKTGKSSLAAQLAAQGFHLTWISMDNGHEVIFKIGLSPEELDNHINLVILPDTKERPVAIQTCLKIISGAAIKICDKHGQTACPECSRKADAPFTTVECNAFGPKDIIVFDHIGQLANSALNYVMLKDKKGDEDKAEWDHYRVQGALMDKFLTNVQVANYNILCITHTAETEMEDGSKKLVPLVGTVPFSRNVGKYFDHIVYCQIMNGKHRFGSSTTYQNKVITGSRSDVVIEKDEKPSLAPFFAGKVLPPEPQGSKAAAKVLAMPVPEPKPPTILEKTIIEEDIKEPTSYIPTTQLTQPTPSSVQSDREALMARLSAMKKGR